jgi:hypothetical protein
MYSPNDKFISIETGQVYVLVSIETTKKIGGKTTTLKDPNCILQKEDKSILPIYLTELNRLIECGRWELMPEKEKEDA